jgi:hypothetical protein
MVYFQDCVMWIRLHIPLILFVLACFDKKILEVQRRKRGRRRGRREDDEEEEDHQQLNKTSVIEE